MVALLIDVGGLEHLTVVSLQSGTMTLSHFPMPNGSSEQMEIWIGCSLSFDSFGKVFHFPSKHPISMLAMLAFSAGLFLKSK